MNEERPEIFTAMTETAQAFDEVLDAVNRNAPPIPGGKWTRLELIALMAAITLSESMGEEEDDDEAWRR